MIIIDIDMPTGCSSCPIYDGEYGECQLRTCFPSRFADVHALFDDRPNKCPLKDRPHGEWIPCSERLPEEDGTYIVCWCGEWGVDVCTTLYSKYGKYWYGISGIERRGITAWMPLPEPYKKEGEQNESNRNQ